MAKIKDKKRILKATREKQLAMYKGTPIKLSGDFSAKTLQTRREWHHVFKEMGKKKKERKKKKANSKN